MSVNLMNNCRIFSSKILSYIVCVHFLNVFVFHNRALKPSNVYIQNNGSHIVVGDFCLPSVLSDLKTHNRFSMG